MNIHKYLRFRATEEGVPFSLPVNWFVYWIELGCRDFFSCTVDNDGNVLSDIKDPSCLQRFWFSLFLEMREPYPFN